MGKKKIELGEEKLHYLIAVAAITSWLLYFAAKLDFYDSEKILSGITFISITAPLYAVCVFAYYHLNGSNT
ncbi:hypothetical protein SAMN04487936_11154 [Halobacillus dabanensis]|uniref:Uncharacterized protein n=1 Tax=Halobacillus dabanensis TaxID=240302 RepID=A0A1I3YJX7_HALDA|nr:hypothetical protein [Halobacillus dabanensis]SFK32142.1 hypothetical protein SAMN04487936_11154 [Halobacillus dabanensis]